MSSYKRPILSAVIGIALGLQQHSDAFAGPASIGKHGGIGEQYVKQSREEWGWWVKADWTQYQKNKYSKSAIKMLKKAAVYGNAQAQYVLGMLYSNEERDEKAMYWLSKAAGQGHNNAQFTYNYYMNRDDNNYGLGC